MTLPCELIDEILCRLPVKYLLRCRCVSKEWCSIIDSAAFIKKHLQNSVECNPDGDAVIITGADSYLTDLDSLCAAGDDDVVVVIGFHDSLKAVLSDSHFVGAANCLVCFCKNNMKEFLVLNPSTRKYRKVPSMPGKVEYWFDMIEISPCGFGYDHVNDDYKIVRVAQFKQENLIHFHAIVVMVYSLKSNNWTHIQDVPSDIGLVTLLGMFTSGALHWLANKFSEDFYHKIIVGFDLGIEQFKELPFPTVNGDFSVPTAGSLCIFENHTNSRMDVWLKNNNGLENPWYKAFSVEQPGPLTPFEFIRPVAFSKSGKDVLLEVDNTKLVWYDPERKVVKNVRIHGIPNRFGSQLYRESLLQLTESEQLQKPSEDKKEKKQQKKRDNFLSKGFKLKL